jgi:hypothetical protein
VEGGEGRELQRPVMGGLGFESARERERERERKVGKKMNKKRLKNNILNEIENLAAGVAIIEQIYRSILIPKIHAPFKFFSPKI